VDIDLSVPRDLWIRSSEMDVEIGGELIVRYDRREGDLVMVGDLQALRGSYQVFGRTFDVDGGTVSFLGQPGVNPALNIEALSRIRRRQGDRLEVRATVRGTLVQPLVTLSTTEAGLSQPDLVSYLLFGVPSGELGVATPGSGLSEGVTTGGVLLVSGTLGSQIGTAIAQETGWVDYFAISQGDVLANRDIGQNFLSSLSTAQYEVGRYFGDDIFVVFVLGAGPAAQDQGIQKLLRGVRVELALSDEWFVEGFVEDRFLRTSSALMQTGLDGEEVVGVLVFRDWGFGSREQNSGAP
jgi:translocation and assembly module TamB